MLDKTQESLYTLNTNNLNTNNNPAPIIGEDVLLQLQDVLSLAMECSVYEQIVRTRTLPARTK